MATDSGYEGGGREPFHGVQIWALEKWHSPMMGDRMMGLLVVIEDGERSTRGSMEFESEDEFLWLKGRIDGERII